MHSCAADDICYQRGQQEVAVFVKPNDRVARPRDKTWSRVGGWDCVRAWRGGLRCGGGSHL